MKRRIWKGLLTLFACVMLVCGASACGDEEGMSSSESVLSSESAADSSSESSSTEDSSSSESAADSSSESSSAEDSSSSEAEKVGSVGLLYAMNEEGTGYTVTGLGDCTDTDVIIPATYKDLPVLLIEGYAFSSCISLTSVTIPNSVTTIGEEAFENCSSLTSVTIPNSVTTIGGSAFYNCRSLTSITIPNSVTTIEQYAFSDCSSLTSVTIPNSVTTIGYRAFDNCSSLTSITVGENNTAYKSIDGNLYTKDGTTLIQYAIGKTATEFIIPNSVTTIGECAFNNCSSLTSVIFEDAEGWVVNFTSISSTDLANAKTAKIFLTSTYVYDTWTKE